MERAKILVVDDESRLRKLVRDFLVKSDYEVIEAENGEATRSNSFLGKCPLQPRH